MTPVDSGLPQCLRKPIPEIAQAAAVLQVAVDAHLAGRHGDAAVLIASTNTDTIREWVESLWGKKCRYLLIQKLPDAPPRWGKDMRIPRRMSNTAQQTHLIAEQGRHCRFCGIPLIRAEVRRKLHKLYPKALPWAPGNRNQHAAFQAMWLQFDHLLPHSRGGKNDLDNVVITCAPCNYSRMQYTLAELGLDDPMTRPRVVSEWNGLEQIMARG
jgi:hypothetical protein